MKRGSTTISLAPRCAFASVTHAVPMLSLANAFSDEDVAESVAAGRLLRLSTDYNVDATEALFGDLKALLGPRGVSA